MEHPPAGEDSPVKPADYYQKTKYEGEKVVERIIEELDEVSTVESPAKLFGRFITAVLAPSLKKKK